MPAPHSRGARVSSLGIHYDARDLRRFAWAVGRSSDTMLRAERAFYMASARTVASMAESQARSLGSTAAKSASDVRTAGANTVVYGGQGYNMGAEFGSYRYKQFKMWRGNKDDAGYFLWPSVRQFRDKEFQDKWQRDVWRAVRQDVIYG